MLNEKKNQVFTIYLHSNKGEHQIGFEVNDDDEFVDQWFKEVDPEGLGMSSESLIELILSFIIDEFNGYIDDKDDHISKIMVKHFVNILRRATSKDIVGLFLKGDLDEFNYEEFTFDYRLLNQEDVDLAEIGLLELHTTN